MATTFDDQLSLVDGMQANLIDGQWFLPFTLYRLQPYASDQQLVLTVTLEHILSEPT